LISISNEKSNLSEGRVRIIAGDFNGVKGPATTFTQVDMWDVLITNNGNE